MCHAIRSKKSRGVFSDKERLRGERCDGSFRGKPVSSLEG
jgi:hypothetical protein